MRLETSDVVPWTIGDMLWATGLFLLGLAAASGIAGVLRRLGVASPSPIAGADVGGLAIALLEGFILIPVWFFGVHRYRVGWSALGFRSFPLMTGCGLAVSALFLSFIVNFFWALVLFSLGWPGQPNFLPVFGQGPAGLLVALVVGTLVAPLAEEAFFRGFLLAGLRKYWGLGWALVASAALFALLHFTPTVIVPLFVLGLLLGLLYVRTNSLGPGILMHATVNSLALLVQFATR